jgi:hypothetical protein
MDFIKKLWASIKKIGKQLWSLVSDRQWDADPYKIAGFGCVIFAVILAFRVFTAATAGKTGTDLATLAGLVGSIIAVGTFLFSQARKSDETLPKARSIETQISIRGDELQAIVDKAKDSIARENADAVSASTAPEQAQS